jgi:cytochrome P450
MTKSHAIASFTGMSPLASLSAFRHNPVDMLLAIARQHPEIARVRYGVIPVLVVSDPALAHELLVDKADAFIKTFGLTLFARPVLGQGLLTLERVAHRKRRRLVSPPFMARRVAGYADEIAQRAERSAQRIGALGQLDVSAETMRLTLEIIVKTMFGAEIAAAGDTVGSAFNRALHSMVESLTSPIPLPPPIPTPANLRLRRAARELDAIVYRIIREHRSAATSSGDLLSILLEARDQDDGSPLSDRELRDEAMTIMIAGHETTANALAWSLYALARAPEVRARLEAELDCLTEPRIGVQQLAALPWTLQVIKETLRLYPPVYMITRRATRSIDLGPYHVPRGCIVAINIVGIQRRPDIYADPEHFDPERFSPEREKVLPKQAFLPFSGGPRVCIGNHFALMEAQLILATWLRQLRFELLEPEQRVDFEAIMTLRPKGGLPMRVQARAPEPAAGELAAAAR